MTRKIFLNGVLKAPGLAIFIFRMVIFFFLANSEITGVKAVLRQITFAPAAKRDRILRSATAPPPTTRQDFPFKSRKTG